MRRRRAGSTLLFTSVVATAVATMAVAADEELPDKAKVQALRLDEIPARLYVLPRRVEVAAAQPAVAVDVGGTRLLFFDVNGNGRWDDPGIDGWRPDQDAYPFAVPVEDSIVVGGRRTALRFADDGRTLRYRQTDAAWPDAPEGADKDTRAAFRGAAKSATRALAVWNDLRLRNGLPPVHLDAMLTRACQLHAIYMARWGITHDEIADQAGYSPEGDRAGRSGCVGSHPAPDEVREVYSTFYHRISLFHPGTRGVGIGEADGRTVLNGTEDRIDRPWTWPVAIPAAGTTDVPLTYVEESPRAHEPLRVDGTIDRPGFPITLTFERDTITAVAAELRVDGPDGDAVAFELSWPERPAHESQPTNYKSILLLPHAPLKTRSTYWVHVEWTYRGTPDGRTWTFRTGR